MKRIMSILTVLCLLLTMMPLSVWAKTAADIQMPARPVLTDPRDPQVQNLERLEKKLNILPADVAPMSEEYVTEEEAIALLREQMKKRVNNITIKVKTTDNNANSVFQGILDGALAHTGEPGAGDNLEWQRGSIGVGNGYSGYISGGVCYYTLPYQVDYYSTAAQEAELDAAVDALMDEWAYLEGASDLEKVDTIYDYITANVVYDYEHLNDPDYDLMYTAYAAMIDGTAVCQGYANLFYRLALELGVDTRIVVGNGWTGSQWGAHAWNLVDVDGLYYYVDSTWDATYAQAGWPYQWYLLGSENFGMDHVYDPYWIDFLGDYPISATDHADGGSLPEPGTGEDPNAELASGTCGDNVTWSLSQGGVLTISGTGPTWGYPEEVPGFYQYEKRVKECIIEEGVTALGEWIFWDCRNLTNVTIPDSLTEIGYGAFAYCYSLTTVSLGSGINFIDYYAFRECYNLTDVYYNGSQAQWDQIFIYEENDYLLSANIHFAEPAVSCGDTNADGNINALDLVALRQYLAGWDVNMDPAAADTNADGNVNALDLVRLRQYLAGWDVTLG